MTTTTHTPTPWIGLNNGRDTPTITDAHGDELAAMLQWRRNNEDVDAANAAFIATACNAHDDLVAALRAIANVTSMSGATKMKAIANAALAKVTP